MKNFLKIGLIILATIIITITVMLLILKPSAKISGENTEVTVKKESVGILDIELNYTDLIIKKGEKFKVETNNKYVSVSENGNKLFVKEKKHRIFSKDSDADITIYVPDNIFEKVDIEAGAGQVNISELKANELEIEFGAGQASINNLYVYKNAYIDGGSGNISINSSTMNNLELDLGVGKFVLNALLTGNSNIETGVGSFEANLVGDDYMIEFDSGIGKATYNGEKMEKNNFYGKGKNRIELEAGVGVVKITTER